MVARLRNFDQMWNAYPNPGGPAAEVKATIGGRVDSEKITNTCVIRISRAFNYSANPIPKSSRDEILTVPGADGLQYALRVREFTRYLRRRYGDPDLTASYEDPGGGEVPPSFSGEQGVIIFEVVGWRDATGHADLWRDQECRHHAYFNRASKVMLWRVPDTPQVPLIGGPVGAGGTNRGEDVRVVQQLLIERGVDPGPVDGVVGSKTIAAIRQFQSTFLARPDGRVDPDGRTYTELLGL